MIKEILIRRIRNCKNDSLLLALFQILHNTEKAEREEGKSSKIIIGEKQHEFKVGY